MSITMLECFDIVGYESQEKIRNLLEQKIISAIEKADFSEMIKNVVSVELESRIEYWIDDIDSSDIVKKLADIFLKSL